jgi:hypothetical protein
VLSLFVSAVVLLFARSRNTTGPSIERHFPGSTSFPALFIYLYSIQVRANDIGLMDVHANMKLPQMGVFCDEGLTKLPWKIDQKPEDGESSRRDTTSRESPPSPGNQRQTQDGLLERCKAGGGVGEGSEA